MKENILQYFITAMKIKQIKNHVVNMNLLRVPKKDIEENNLLNTKKEKVLPLV